MAEFQEERLEVNGIETAVFTAGEGETLVFFHGAGTTTGFDALLPLADRCRLVVPHHPGFGDSADDPRIDDIHDYVLHYLDLFDRLGIRELSLVGHSLGGWLAARFAIEQAPRVHRLVLASPVGLRAPDHPTRDLFTIPDDEMLAHLAADQTVFAGKVPLPPTPEFLAASYRETTSAARVMWEHPFDAGLPRWLHRLTMPALVLWGAADRIVPVEQAALWCDLLPDAERHVVPGAGHLVFDESAQAAEAVSAFVGEALTV